MHVILFVQLKWLGKRLPPSGHENVASNMHSVLVRISSANQSERRDIFTSVESTNNYVGACKCTDGKFENQYGECVHKDECPCTFRNRFYNVLQWFLRNIMVIT